MAIELGALVEPSHTALLLQEVQQGVLGPTSILPALAEAAADLGVVEHIAALAGAARSVGVRVVHCTAENLAGGFGMNRNARLFAGVRRAGATNIPGSASVQPLPEVGPAEDDIVLPRYHGLSPMSGTQLDALLRNQGVTTIVVTGVSLNIAIPNLVFDAVNHSYQVVLVTDAVAGVPPDFASHIIEHSLSLVSTMATTAELLSAWDRAT